MATGHVGCSHVVREIGNILAVLAKNTTLITAERSEAVISHLLTLGTGRSRSSARVTKQNLRSLVPRSMGQERSRVMTWGPNRGPISCYNNGGGCMARNMTGREPSFSSREDALSRQRAQGFPLA